MLNQAGPFLVAGVIVVVLVRRMTGEPVDLKDVVASPAILLFLGVRDMADANLTAVDLGWIVGLSVVSVLFGAIRSTTTVFEHRQGRLFQLYRWRTLAWMVGSLVAGACLGWVAHHLGMHDGARPMTFSVGIGLAGEAVVTLLRAYRHGAAMPWSEGAGRQGSDQRK